MFDVYKEIAKNLRGIRAQRSYPVVRALARDAGITPAYLRQIERGQARPSMFVILNICDCLGCTPDFLIYGGEKGVLYPDQDWEPTVQRIRRLNPAHIPELSRIIDKLERQDGVEQKVWRY